MTNTATPNHVHAEDPTTDPHADLQARWRPSDEQVRQANALLAAGYDAVRGPRGERGVFTVHVLVNKIPGFWTTDVEVVPVDGVFTTRDGAYLAAISAAERHAQHDTGVPVLGGYAWHSAVDRWAVWEA